MRSHISLLFQPASYQISFDFIQKTAGIFSKKDFIDSPTREEMNALIQQRFTMLLQSLSIPSTDALPTDFSQHFLTKFKSLFAYCDFLYKDSVDEYLCQAIVYALRKAQPIPSECVSMFEAIHQTSSLLDQQFNTKMIPPELLTRKLVVHFINLQKILHCTPTMLPEKILNIFYDRLASRYFQRTPEYRLPRANYTLQNSQSHGFVISYTQDHPRILDVEACMIETLNETVFRINGLISNKQCVETALKLIVETMKDLVIDLAQLPGKLTPILEKQIAIAAQAVNKTSPDTLPIAVAIHFLVNLKKRCSKLNFSIIDDDEAMSKTLAGIFIAAIQASVDFQHSVSLIGWIKASCDIDHIPFPSSEYSAILTQYYKAEIQHLEALDYRITVSEEETATMMSLLGLATDTFSPDGNDYLHQVRRLGF